MLRLSSARIPKALCCIATAVIAPVAVAQQFQDQTTTRYPQPNLSEYTNQMTVGDLDGDGDLDIVFANGGNFSSAGTPQQLRIFINTGLGVFTDESAARAPGMVFLARGAELGDVDDDGDLDIIVAQDFDRRPQLLINNGSGFFANSAPGQLPLTTLGSARAQFADVDNDGDLDIYLVNGGASRFGTGQGKLYINDGSGFFTDETAARMPAQNVSEPQDCIFGDIDNDFDLDLRIGSTAMNQGKIYKNNGSGIFAAATAPSDNNCYSYDFGDIDGDGDLDMLGANAHPTSLNGELLLRNSGTGSYAALPVLPSSTTDDNDSKFLDYDNDGDLDLVIASLGSTERIYSNNGTGTFALVNGVITAVSDSSLDVEVADFNGDGRLDIITAQGESGSFVNRIFMNVTGPVDTIAPKIVRTEQLADAPASAAPFYVRTIVYDGMTSDRGFHNKGIVLNYSVNNDGVQQVPMKWVGNSQWRGEIPGQPSGSNISYFVTATDFANNVGTGLPLSFNILLPPCPPDTNGDHVVNVTDLLAVINAWGPITPVNFNVNVMDFSFAPATVDAKSGDSITWTWVSGVHTVTSGTPCVADGTFDQILSSPGTFTYNIPTTFSGAIPYFCIPHCAAGMTGTINVQKIPTDINGDGAVNVSDLLAVINAWGPCPQ